MSRTFGFLVASLVWSCTSLADPIDDIVTAAIERQHIPGLSIAIVKDGTLVKRAGYGLANVELGVPVNQDTRFQSASVGKQFSAALVLLLEADRKLSIDAPVANYLTGAPPAWQRITVRQLLNHTAGLADLDPAIDMRKDYSEDELLASAFKVPLISTPGEKWSYSNIGYQVLGILCSKVGGKFYGDQLRERIFAPLGMSTQVIKERAIVPHRAAGYDRVRGQLLNQVWVSPTMNSTADGSFYLTATDLAIWSIALESDFPLSAAMRAASWSPATLTTGGTTEYGFGWHIGEVGGHRFVDHTGAWQGFNSYFVRFVDDRLAIAVLANRSGGAVHLIADKIANHYLPGLYGPASPPLTSKVLTKTPIYLRGSHNAWDTRHHMRAQAPGIYSATIALEAGRAQFKIASKEWNKVIFGARFDENEIALGQPQRLEEWGEDLLLDIETRGSSEFRLDARYPQGSTLTIRPAAPSRSL